jgi:uncharacterized membrane protein
MPKEECCGIGVGRLLIRLIIALVVASIVLQIFFSIRFDWPAVFVPGIFWNVIGILILIWVISWFFRMPYYHGHWEHAMEMRIIRRRYAKGEINQVQFKRMIKDLQKHES